MTREASKAWYIILIVILLASLPIGFTHDIAVDTNTQFTLPTYGTYITFDSAITLDSVYRESDYWYFDTYGFQVQVANLEITDFFESNPDQLSFDLIAASGTSTTKLYTSTKGEPSDVTGESSWSYDAGTKIATIYATHSSTVSIVVSWVAGADTTPPTYSDVAHNTTIEFLSCKFSSKWTDDTALLGYYFLWNESGSWTSFAWALFTANPDWANVTYTLPIAGTVLGYRWNATDTSGNWVATSIYTLTVTATGENSVVLNSPSDDGTVYANTESFTYTPTLYQTIQNSSIWTNITGVWQRTSWNITTVTNNTVNSFSHTFTVSGVFLWNIAVYNTTDMVFAEFNRTLVVYLEPRCTDTSYSNTIAGQSSTFSATWLDGNGLSGYIYSWDASGTWVNETWIALSGSPLDALVAIVKTLPSNEGIVVGDRWYMNDTDDKWGVSTLETLTTTAGPASFSPLLTFLFEGDWLGFSQAIYVAAFMSVDLFYGFIILLLMAPLYIRTRSLLLMVILWILLGSSIILAAPMLAGLGMIFMALGIAGALVIIYTTLR